MIANLPMYQRPELVDAHNEYWALIRQNLRDTGIDAPEQLSQSAGEMEVWTQPNLVLSQTCGRPYSTILHENVTLIGTADFGVDDCLPGYYRSAFIIHKDDTRTELANFKDALFAYNGELSQSGYNAPKKATKKLGFFFENQICSGGHLNSAKLIANKNAEIAAIDTVSLTFMEQYENLYGQLKILCLTPPTPSLPYISAKGADKDAFFNAIKQAIHSLPDATREKIRIKDLIDIPKQIYLSEFAYT